MSIQTTLCHDDSAPEVAKAASCAQKGGNTEVSSFALNKCTFVELIFEFHSRKPIACHVTIKILTKTVIQARRIFMVWRSTASARCRALILSN